MITQNGEAEFATLKQIATETGLNETSLAIKISVARKQGVEPPLRKRVGRMYLYHKPSFLAWLWENTDAYHRPVKISDATE